MELADAVKFFPDVNLEKLLDDSKVRIEPKDFLPFISTSDWVSKDSDPSYRKVYSMVPYFYNDPIQEGQFVSGATCYIKEDEMKKVDEIFVSLPNRFLLDLGWWARGIYEIGRKELEYPFYEALLVIRAGVNFQVIEQLKSYPCEDKYKNVVLGMIRASVKQITRDHDGD